MLSVVVSGQVKKGFKKIKFIINKNNEKQKVKKVKKINIELEVKFKKKKND